MSLNNVFFHLLYCHLTKISEKRSTSDQKIGAEACQKQIKTILAHLAYRVNAKKRVISNDIYSHSFESVWKARTR